MFGNSIFVFHVCLPNYQLTTGGQRISNRQMAVNLTIWLPVIIPGNSRYVSRRMSVIINWQLEASELVTGKCQLTSQLSLPVIIFPGSSKLVSSLSPSIIINWHLEASEVATGKWQLTSQFDCQLLFLVRLKTVDSSLSPDLCQYLLSIGNWRLTKWQQENNSYFHNSIRPREQLGCLRTCAPNFSVGNNRPAATATSICQIWVPFWTDNWKPTASCQFDI